MASKKRMTKAQLFSELAEATEIPKKKVADLFDALTETMKKQLKGKVPTEFVFPGLLKIRVVEKPATKERQGKDPRTGNAITIPAKPKSKRVSVRPLKGLKEMVL